MGPPSRELQQRRTSLKTSAARSLRTNATDAERRLWGLLRRKQLGGVKFRRQQPIGPYIVDFYCSSAKLVIELDGGHHNEGANLEYDERRTLYLRKCGYRVLRFGNPDLLKNQQSVLDTIWQALLGSNVPLPAQSQNSPPSP